MEQMFGWPAGRGIFTIWIGHVMLCVSYVAIIVQSRVKEMQQVARRSRARSWRHAVQGVLPDYAAVDLAGADFRLAAVVHLSLDDLVLSAFLSGPGSTTLPLVVFSRWFVSA